MFVAFMVTRFVNALEDPSLGSELQKQSRARDGNSLLERKASDVRGSRGRIGPRRDKGFGGRGKRTMWSVHPNQMSRLLRALAPLVGRATCAAVFGAGPPHDENASTTWWTAWG